MNVQDRDENDGFIGSYRAAIKSCKYFFHIAYLEACQFSNYIPKGLAINKTPFISFISDDIVVNWESNIHRTEKNLLETLIYGIVDKMTNFEVEFWSDLGRMMEDTDMGNLEDWLVKLVLDLRKEERASVKRKKKKLRGIVNPEKKKTALERFDEHLHHFNFLNEFLSYLEEFFPDVFNIINLVDISSFNKSKNIDKPSAHDTEDPTEKFEKNISNSGEDKGVDDLEDNSCACVDGRFVGHFVSPNVVNLSGRKLSKAEISLLSKGLKFIPTPRNVDRVALKEDLELFGRKLRLAWHFRNDEKTFESNPFRRKSKFNPKGKDAAIELYLSRLEEEILAIDTNLKYSNLTREERNAMYALRDDNSIIIKEADKGSAVVVWDKCDYLAEASKQLNDKNVYEEISGDIVSPLIDTVRHCLARVKLRGDICNETMEYFFVDKPRVGRFYLLPKIHKRLSSVPGRPVISNSSYFTENISSFLDFHLKPLSQKVKSFIKDTNDFLRKLRDLPPLPDDCIMCTVDVVGLYPNIPHDGGLEALKVALDNRQDKSVSTETLLDLAECVLKNNVFEHNNTCFKQKQGTAIGTKMAPSYAILFMSYIENQILESSVLQPLVWWRYIDDIFLIWQHGEENLKIFLEHLNNFHPTIKFTADYSHTKVNFLDVQVIRSGNKLITDLYIKPTDTHQYLEASSCHVYHCKSSIPYSQALRLNRICSESKFFDNRCNQLESWLMERGYNDKLVRRKVLEARGIDRNSLLDKPPNGPKESKLTVNITYHPSFSRLREILAKIHLLLTPNQEHRDVFSNIPIIGFRNGRNLKSILVRAKIPVPRSGEGSCVKCLKRNCGVCKYIKTTSEFSDKDSKNTYQIKLGPLNCSSSMLVYLIQCKTCKLQYVGSTTTAFRLRFNNYKSHNKKFNLKQSGVPQESFHAHFNTIGHNGKEDWEVTLIDQAQTLASVRRKECFWQYKLDTFIPNGLNEREVSMDFG